MRSLLMTSVKAPHREKGIQLDDSGGHCCWLCGPAVFDHLVLVAKEEATKVTCYVYFTCYTVWCSYSSFKRSLD